MNIQSDWMSNASSGLFINLFIYLCYVDPLVHILGCNIGFICAWLAACLSYCMYGEGRSVAPYLNLYNTGGWILKSLW